MTTWQVLTYDDLTKDQLYTLAYERQRTFVADQQRPYQDLDDVDRVARHILGYQGDQLVAYARAYQEGDHAKFGRVLTIPEVRGQGLGRCLMDQITAELARDFPGEPVEILAQVGKRGFYEKFGYVAVGDDFLYHHTWHVRMIYRVPGVLGA